VQLPDRPGGGELHRNKGAPRPRCSCSSYGRRRRCGSCAEVAAGETGGPGGEGLSEFAALTLVGSIWGVAAPGRFHAMAAGWTRHGSRCAMKAAPGSCTRQPGWWAVRSGLAAPDPVLRTRSLLTHLAQRERSLRWDTIGTCWTSPPGRSCARHAIAVRAVTSPTSARFLARTARELGCTAPAFTHPGLAVELST
jgi:hypothetical protein